MPRKRQEGLTSGLRYRLKMARMFYHPGIPSEEIMKLADQITRSRDMGYAAYKQAWVNARSVLSGKVSSVLYGAYRSATLEFVRKVLQQKVMTPEEWLDKWARNQLDPGILREIADKLMPLTPPPSGAEPQQKVS